MSDCHKRGEKAGWGGDGPAEDNPERSADAPFGGWLAGDGCRYRVAGVETRVGRRDAENGVAADGGVADRAAVVVVRGSGGFAGLADAVECLTDSSRNSVARPSGNGMRGWSCGAGPEHDRIYLLPDNLVEYLGQSVKGHFSAR